MIQLLILVAVVFALLWFGLPIGASWLATNALNASGFTGTNTKVEVSSNPPPLLLTGHADTVHLTSSQVGIGDLHAATLDLTLGKVELFSRQIGTVTGTLAGVRVAAPDGQPVTIDLVTLSGAASSATAEMDMSVTEAERLAASQLKSRGIAATVTLAPPDKITVTAGGKSQPGHLLVKEGALLLVPDGDSLPTVILIAAGGGNPFEMTSVRIGADHVTLMGTIDLQALLGI
ncbi:MAG: hypothetical protein ABSE70_11030 [Candidatus Limnocylindrales bacterium]